MPPNRQPKRRIESTPATPPSETHRKRVKVYSGCNPPTASSADSEVTGTTGKGKTKDKRDGKAKDWTVDYPWHPNVDYTVLLEPERQSRVILNLFTIFSLGARNGLTVDNVKQMAHELDMTDLARSSPITIRNAIQRWNTTIFSATNEGRMCDKVGCKQPASWGHFMEDPLTCEQHKQDEMILLVPGRLVQFVPGLHGKYFMTDPLYTRLFSLSPLDSVTTTADELDHILAGLV